MSQPERKPFICIVEVSVSLRLENIKSDPLGRKIWKLDR